MTQKYYDGMGLDITAHVRNKISDIERQLMDALNENLTLKQERLELKQQLETHAETITGLTRAIKELKTQEKEESPRQPKKRTRRTGAATPSAPPASANSNP